MHKIAGIVKEADWFPSNHFPVGLWLLKYTDSKDFPLIHFIFVSQKGEIRLICFPPTSSLDLYGERTPSALSQPLESLAAWTLNPSTWRAENDTFNRIWMPVQGVCWFLCCRQGFSLLGRDYGEKEEEESFELRNKEDLTPNGRVKKKKKKKITTRSYY